MFVGPYPPPYSGPELGMKQFLESRLSDDFDIRFVKTNFRSSNSEKGSLGLSAAVWVSVFHFRLLWNLISFRPALVYYPITATAAGWIARDIPCILMSRLLGAKVVIHLRAGHLKLNYRSFPPTVRRLIKWSCAKVAMALVQAERLKDQFADLVSPQRLKVLPQAIDTNEYNSVEEMAEPTKLVLFLGNLSYSKGYCDLVRAIPIVAEAVKDVKFVFCGSIVDEYKTGVYFDQRTGKKLNHESARVVHSTIQSSRFRENYEWRGVVSGADKMALLRSCALVALPSYSEGFSRALMEAMSVGKPVIYTAVGDHPEFIAHGVNGLMVDPGDVKGLASTIISLLQDEALQEKIGRTNYQYVRGRFDVDVIAKQLSGIFAEVITPPIATDCVVK